MPSTHRRRPYRPALEALGERVQPAALNPVYAVTFADAVTADNNFATDQGKTNWTIDDGADSYQTDTYERPTAQTYQVRKAFGGGERFAAEEYFSNLDIAEGKAGFDADYLYVSVKMAGLSKHTSDGKAAYEGLAYRYGFRIAKQADGGGGLLVVADQPQFKNSPNTAFGQVGTFVYRDANGDVGGTGLDVTKQDRQAEVNGNGYERVGAADGRTPAGRRVLWTRVSPTDPTAVEFALDYKAFGYTQADLAALPYLQFEANKGLQDPGNYLWNDEYTKSEAGSPYRAAAGDRTKSEFGTQGLGNVYELDTLAGGRIAAPAGTASVSGFVFRNTLDGRTVPLAGVTITLERTDENSNGVVRTTVTDANGAYRFDGLEAGTYLITETQPVQFADGEDVLGTVDGNQVGGFGDNDQFTNIVLAAGQSGINYNFVETEGEPGGSA